MQKSPMGAISIRGEAQIPLKYFKKCSSVYGRSLGQINKSGHERTGYFRLKFKKNTVGKTEVVGVNQDPV